MNTVHAVFETQARKTPSNIAIKFNGEKIAYEELNFRANYLAAHLISQGVKTGDFVAVSLSHGSDLTITLLAILKCGAAYLPIDTNNPNERIKYCLDQVNAKVLISEKNNNYGKALKVITTDNRSLFSSQLAHFSSRETCQNSPAYVMFTSGSTGKPKGVVVPHRAIVRLVKNTNYISILQDDAILQFAPPSFDASTFEFWGALLNGALLIPYSGEGLDPNTLKQDIEENQVTILWLTAALFHLISDKFIDVLSPLRVLLAGGDVLNPKYINKVLDYYPDLTLINGYGPTENTTFTCCHVMTVRNRPSGKVLIGKPISGTDIMILDDELKPVEVGSTGELFASGKGVALGYLNEPNVQNAFFENSELAEGLIYRTGDVVKENQHGEIEFIGRKDNQVKIRGYRVSLEEIKTNIVELAFVSDALVTTQKFESGDQLLVAYIKVKKGMTADTKSIKSELAKRVPAYMIPNKFVFDDELPINKNGKLDKRKVISETNQEYIEA